MKKRQPSFAAKLKSITFGTGAKAPACPKCGQPKAQILGAVGIEHVPSGDKCALVIAKAPASNIRPELN